VKKELSIGTAAAIIGGVVAVIGLFFLFRYMSGDTPSQQDKNIEEMSVKQAKSEYGRYQNPGGTAETGSGGPPSSGEGAAQAANPGGTAGGK
jgi:hypothetical protein